MSTRTEKMTETAQTCFDAADSIVEAMADGSRIQIKDLAAQVSTMVGMEPRQVLGFVDHYVHKTDIAYVTRGKNGGLIKGQKPAKVVKPKKAKPAADDSNSNQ